MNQLITCNILSVYVDEKAPLKSIYEMKNDLFFLNVKFQVQTE